MHRPTVTRRHFLAASAAGVALPFTGTSGLLADDAPPAGSVVQGKDNRLMVLKNLPPVIETPLKLLYQQHITPLELLFVRNNQQPENTLTLKPVVDSGWKVKISGAVSRAAEISVAQLRELPHTSYEMVLQCSGNGRSLFSKAAQTAGTQWGRGGMGNVVFRGVRLSRVLDKLGVDVDTTARFVNANGSDLPEDGKEDFLHSLPVHDVVNESILALDLNGKPLPAVHGGPVRLITPGVFGTMQIKWLQSLEFVTDETTNYNHAVRYRVPLNPINPGTDYKFTLQNSSYNWKMKVKSVLLTPNDGDRVKAGNVRIAGVAFNDGRVPITAVVVSVDKGQTWKPARLQRPASRFAWTRFETHVQLPAGRHSIWCLAIDDLGRSQPLNGSIAWNPRGYEWNGVEQINVDVV